MLRNYQRAQLAWIRSKKKIISWNKINVKFQDDHHKRMVELIWLEGIPKGVLLDLVRFTNFID